MGFQIENNVLVKYKEEPGVTEVVIPEGVTEIGNGAFYNRIGLTSVTVPKSVTKIGDRAFYDCFSLTSITIPQGVTEIEPGTFHGCRSLVSITIPDSVTAIADDLEGPFYGCSNLCRMRLPAKLLTYNFFHPSSKMLTVELTENGKVTTVSALFRKDYFSNEFLYKNDCLVPIGQEETALFDKILAAGTYDGFNTNEDGRIVAILQRLGDKENPFADEVVPAISSFLVAKLTKVMKKAMENNARENFANLAAFGVFSDAAEKKVIKFLEKEGTEEAKNILSDLKGQSAAAKPKTAEKKFPLDKKYEEAYKKTAAASVAMKYGLISSQVNTADGSGIAPKECPELIVALYLKNDNLIPMADELAETLDRESFADMLLAAFDKLTSKRDMTAFLRPLFRFANEKQVRKLFSYAKRCYLDEDKILSALLLNDSREAMIIADKYHRLDAYARMRNLDEDALRDGKLSDIGLDENGEKRYDLGNQTVTVRMNSDLSFAVFSEGKEKPSKSIPKKDADPEKYAAAEADFSAMKKDAKKIVKNRSDKLFEDFLSGKETEGGNWKTSFLGNAVLHHVAELVVWEQDGKTFTLKDGGAVTSSGVPYAVTDEKIRVAHPIEMNASDVTAWQKYFVSGGLKQPFAQIWEQAVDPTTIKEDRYKGCNVPINFFRGAEKHGLSFYDEDFHDEIGFTVCIQECELEGERTEWRRHELLPDDTFTLGKFTFTNFTRRVNHLVTVLDRWTVFDRIKKDDVSVEPLLGNFTLAQITEFIAAAQENHAFNVTALLLNYKNEHFADFDPMDEFTLDF